MMRNDDRVSWRQFVLGVSALGLVALCAAAASAGGPPPGIPSGVMPWEYHKYQGYQRGPGPRPQAPPPPVVTRTPRTYTLQVTTLPYQHQHVQRDVAWVVAHLPEDAQLFFEDRPTSSQGTLRHYTSPPLTRGTAYRYAVRVVWFEDGEWVSQTADVPIRAGGVHCIDVIHSRSGELEKDIGAALGKLSAEDRASAEAQKYCAVQDGIRLGAMGTPVKVTVNGQTVFLCCRACEAFALKNADQTLKTLERLKAKAPKP